MSPDDDSEGSEDGDDTDYSGADQQPVKECGTTLKIHLDQGECPWS